jgi:hypothetical protein
VQEIYCVFIYWYIESGELISFVFKDNVSEIELKVINLEKHL